MSHVAISPELEASFIRCGATTKDFLLSHQATMSFMAEKDNVRLFDRRADDLYTMTGAITLAPNHFDTIVSILSTSSAPLFRFIMQELFDFIDAQVHYSRHGLSIHTLVIPEPNTTQPPRNLLYAKVNTAIDDHTFVSAWDSHPQLTDMLDSNTRTMPLSHSGMVVQDLGSSGIHVFMTFSEPCKDPSAAVSVANRLYLWLRGLSRLSYVCSSFLLSKLSLYTSCPHPTPSCTTCSKQFSESRPPLFCSVCATSKCSRCVRSFYLVQGCAPSEYHVCAACLAETTQGLSSADSSTDCSASDNASEGTHSSTFTDVASSGPRDVKLTPETVPEYLRTGRTAVNRLITLSETKMSFVRESNGIQVFSTVSASETTFKAVLVAPAYDIDHVLSMLAMNARDKHHFLMSKLFGRNFLQGFVLSSDFHNSLSLNWSIFKGNGGAAAPCDLVYMRYHERFSETKGVSAWQSVTIPGSESWATSRASAKDFTRLHGALWGFVLERRGVRDLVVSFIMSHPHQQLSPWTDVWISKISLSCLGYFCDTMVSYRVTEALASNGGMLMFDDSATQCYMCTRIFFILRSQLFCCLCAQAVCSKCCESTTMLQQGHAVDVRVCLICIGAMASSEGSQLAQSSSSLTSAPLRVSSNSSDPSPAPCTPAGRPPLLELNRPTDPIPMSTFRPRAMQPFLKRRNFRPVHEGNPYGVDFSEAIDDDTYSIRGTVMSAHSLQDILAFFNMETTDSFRYGMGLLFGSLFVDGRVLHETRLDTLNHMSVNWLVLRNPNSASAVPEHCDYVFVKANQMGLDNSNAFSVWQSVVLATHPPMPKGQSVPVERRTMHSFGFYFEDNHGGSVRLHAQTSCPIGLASSATKAWILKLTRSVRHVSEAVLCVQLSAILRTNGHVLAPHHRSDCVLCAKSFNFLRPKQVCFVCGQPVCKKCSSSKHLLQGSDVREARVCFLCCSVSSADRKSRSHNASQVSLDSQPPMRRDTSKGITLLP
ncbi:unnamed protein product [Aphanomyces euteiches]|uniref:FYVE-type domain-containing protein n=1 Tax=Aphanomyces euteiches TaxID=100861 RepID=A0A6G0XLU3_9STRA|nr:hypothetical protein Ae201684_003528 [Aphanomyces euteiches]KAH9098447.1 hypothetical protein Ae201684P_017659 [Aphanomyces euteiches]KAH9145363.1 hypothetical protein AeRB84_010716 [Aphanomyces euteiches]